MRITKTTLFLPALVATACLATGCSSSSRPKQPADIVLGAGGVTYVDGTLQVELTAQALDLDGEPMEKVGIRLVDDGEGLDLEPAEGVTDANGQVTFSAATTVGGPVSFQGQLVEGAIDLGDPVEVDFSLQLDLTATALEFTHPGGQAQVTATVADAAGPVEGALVLLSSNRGADDAIDPAQATTDSDGEAVFQVNSQVSGVAQLSLEVDGLSLSELPWVALDFAGPAVSGTWSLDQPGAVLTAPRVGLLWIEDLEDPLADWGHAELVSQGFGGVPGLGDSGSFELVLPMDAPADQLVDPDPSNPDLPETFVVGIYALAVYDDLDASADFSDGDPVVAVTDQQVLLIYAQGELPDPADLPDAELGYQYMVMGDMDPPTLLPMDGLDGPHALAIDMAPCPTGILEGQVTFGDSLPVDADTRVAVILVDAGLIFSEQGDEIFNVGNFVDMVSAAVPYAADTVVDYSLELPPPGDVHPAYQDYLIEAYPGMPAFGILAAMVYVDSDHNGVFTNDDNDIFTGDQVVGWVDQPFGYGVMLIEWLDGQPGLFANLVMSGLNEGYNLLRGPLEARVMAVLDDTTLELDEALEAGWADLPFRIQREVAGEEQVVMEGADLTTQAMPATRVTSAAGGFSQTVQVGDKLVITNRLDDAELLDMDAPINLRVE